MDDDGTKEENQASTSKKEENRKEEEFDERDRDDHSYSYSTVSVSSSKERSFERSRLEIRADKEARTEQPKNALVKTKVPERKKKPLRRGRVSKRRRSPVRRYQRIRRTIKKKRGNKRGRVSSVSTILSRLSSISSSNAPSCNFCGHRCCGRRHKEKNQRRKPVVRKNIKKSKTAKQKASKAKRPRFSSREKKGHVEKNIENKKNTARQPIDCTPHAAISEAIQIGSKSKILSPLLIKTNATTPNDQQEPESPSFLQITPDMIYESLRRLSTWRNAVAQDVICEHMKLHYPLNTNHTELNVELSLKLRIAAMVGIAEEVRKGDNKYWRLRSKLTQRGITKNHVTLFWQLYADTMSPLNKNGEQAGSTDYFEIDDKPNSSLGGHVDPGFSL